jgi:hypothetical protein
MSTVDTDGLRGLPRVPCIRVSTLDRGRAKLDHVYRGATGEGEQRG